MNKRFKLSARMMAIVIICLLIMSVNLAAALPPLPTEFYGRVRDYNFNGTAGEAISAYDTNGVLCGSFTIVNSGFFGSLTCIGDDPETEEDEGAAPGESIVFRYKGSYTTIMGNNSWDYGAFRYVNLTYPVVYCGDYFCDALYENNLNCPFDCPVYNGSYNYSMNMSNMSSYNYTGGGGSGGGGGYRMTEDSDSDEPLSSITDFYMNYTGLNMSGQEGLGFACTEKWVCGNWSECRIDGYQNRTCIDINNCGTYDTRPAENQKCTYTPTCFDGVRNGLEEGIDCGGLCPPCISCFDGIQNCHDGLCEQDIDCGGPCPPCPTCFDGKQNCHDGECEQGTDCGGPCEKKCPVKQAPRIIISCQKSLNPLSNQSIFFFILLFLAIIIDIAYSIKKMRDVKNDKSLTDIGRIKQALRIKRRMYLFIFISSLISSILYLYYYFFIMCQVEYRFAWVLLALLIIMPLIIHQIIRHMEYTEKKGLKKVEALLNTHYRQIEKLIRIENENLVEMEEEIADELYRLLERPEYSSTANASRAKALKKIYAEMVSLFSMYKELKNPIEQEKVLCDDIYKMINYLETHHITISEPGLARIISKLKLLYKQYEQKQKLYDEIGKIEYSREELMRGLYAGESENQENDNNDNQENASVEKEK